MTTSARAASFGRPRAVLPQAQVRAALEAGELDMYYQPIVALDTGRVRGVEALLRWQHPHGGTLPPDDFLPAVEHTSVMHEITRWTLDTSLRALQSWPEWTMSLNVSAVDVTRPRLIDDVVHALATNGIRPDRLTLELTEQAVVQNMGRAVKVLGELRELGVGLSLDDFGTGYSSLLYLRDLPITEVKIDRTFVSRIRSSREDLAIVKSVARLGRSLGLGVIAEGIESVTLARAVRDAHCTAAQGYLWGEPQPADGVDPTLRFAAPRLAPALSNRPRVPRNTAHKRVLELLHQGASLHTIASALNREGLRTVKRLRWTPATVALVIAAVQGTPKPEPESPDGGHDAPG